MNGAQDLGGQMGFGPIAPEPDEPVFHAEWERRALGLSLAFAGVRQWSIDASRHSRERLPPAQYLTKSYYDIWVTALADMLVVRGLATREELQSGHALSAGKSLKAASPADMLAAIARGSPYQRPAKAPARFAVGDAVRTKVMHPTTHTRLPRYARGKLGLVEAIRGAHVFPDTNAHGLGEGPEWLYTVRFAGTELWGAAADRTLSVSIDAFEPYLDPA
jgi:nitrile hydratase